MEKKIVERLSANHYVVYASGYDQCMNRSVNGDGKKLSSQIENCNIGNEIVMPIYYGCSHEGDVIYKFVAKGLGFGTWSLIQNGKQN